MTYWFDPIIGGANGPGGAGLANAYASQGQVNNYNANQAAMIAANSGPIDPWANTPGRFRGADGLLRRAWCRLWPGHRGLQACDARQPQRHRRARAGSASATVAEPDYVLAVGGRGGFDPVQYLQQNPDVAAAGADPWEHAQRFGFKEKPSGHGLEPVHLSAAKSGRQSRRGIRQQRSSPSSTGSRRACTVPGLEGLTQVPQAQPLSAQKSPYAGVGILGPGANPTYFNPATYAGDKSNYGLPFNPAGLPRAPTPMPSFPQKLLGYDPNTSASFAPGTANHVPGSLRDGLPERRDTEPGDARLRSLADAGRQVSRAQSLR